MSDEKKIIVGTNQPESDFVKNLPDHRKTITITSGEKKG